MFIRSVRNLAVLFILLSCSSALFAVDWQQPDSVVAAAVEQSPSLAALDAQIRAATERTASAGSLPNPMLMAGVENGTVDLSYDFMTMYTVGVSQTLVRKGRREALLRGAQLDVERLRNEYDARKAEVEREVRTAYIEAATSQSQVAATEEIARLMKSVTESSRIRYETGTVPQSDLIRAMLEESTVQHQLITLRRQRNVAVARILPLLRLPPDTAVPLFSLNQGMEHGHDHSVDASLPEMTPAIAGLHAEVARADQEIRLAKLARKPDFSVEASYGFRPRDVDMVTILGRIELPVRRSTLIEPRIREAVARREAALQQIEALRLQLQADLGAAVVLRNEAIEQINLHVEKLVPAGKLGFESALGSYQAGKTTFDSVLGALRSWLALNVDYYDYLRQQMEAEIDINAIRRGAHSGVSGASAMTPALPSSSSTTSATAMQ